MCDLALWTLSGILTFSASSATALAKLRLAQAGGTIHDEGLATRPCEVVSDLPQRSLAQRRGSVLDLAHSGKPEVEPALVCEGGELNSKLGLCLVKQVKQLLAQL